jgi:hypothetical protein
MRHLLPLLLLLLLLPVNPASAQSKILIEGRVYDVEYPSFRVQHLMIISQRSKQGVFGDTDNHFIISILPDDTLLISAAGYEMKKISFRDSLPRERYTIQIPVKKLAVELKGFTIDRKRELPEIERDISKLGYNPNDFRIHGSEAWMSPISALYSEFSKKERAKRQVAEWMNRDNRNALLKELFRYYERSGLMRLPEDRYDDFITFLHLTDDQLRAFSQYDLAIYIRKSYFAFIGDWK